VRLPAATARALLRLSARRETPLDAVVSAAYAKVLATLTGDPTVLTGYLPEAGPTEPTGDAHPLPCRVPVTGESWAALLDAASTALTTLERHRSASVEGPRGEADPAEPVFEALLVAGRAPVPRDLPAGTVLAVGLDRDADPPTLAVIHRPEAVDAGQAGRIAGYLLTALAAIAAEPAADHRSWNPVSAAERAFQLSELAGPHRELPDRRVHELFEEQVRLRPDDIAVVHRTHSWTYRELNRRANRLAHALRRAGLEDEHVVAVVTERNPDWAAAVLAVLKAGGVYLPIEPHFPAGRMADMLVRSDCAHVLAQRGAAPELARALDGLPGIRLDHLDALLAQDHPETDLALPVRPGQSAYIYFTSGSTGRPKGAVCEHAGFLNHLFAKIDDLDLAAGRVVAQTAPQCFDISLWQLVAALAVGGRTHIVEQDVVMDVARFVDLLDAGGVEVLQVVPSYLEAVLAELERNPRELPRLRCVSATGEALKKELAERWFATFPEVALVNAYGLTETSDDTNHEVMWGVPDRASVPLGRPIANVRVYVVDERLNPVPLGAPGEIVFSGVCVGRGYVNDEERTRAAFVPDPHVPGERMYRSGDFGRWLPDGRLEFLGRRDAQVKIRGFRIEMGEVENRLLRVPGVRDSAVVVVGEGEGRQLAAFYTGADAPTAEEIARALAAVLPAYMVPSRSHRSAALPLTPNGKIDRNALTRLAERLGAQRLGAAGEGTAGEGTPALHGATERRLAGLWSAALKVPVDRIGRTSHFFDLGGTSLSMLRLAIALDRVASPAELHLHPVLADAAALLERRFAEVEPDALDRRKTVR
jgi:amino acid adenylation domain-containing protein